MINLCYKVVFQLFLLINLFVMGTCQGFVHISNVRHIHMIIIFFPWRSVNWDLWHLLLDIFWYLTMKEYRIMRIEKSRLELVRWRSIDLFLLDSVLATEFLCHESWFLNLEVTEVNLNWGIRTAKPPPN